MHCGAFTCQSTDRLLSEDVQACVSCCCRYEAAVRELAAVRQNMERAAAELIHSRAALGR